MLIYMNNHALISKDIFSAALEAVEPYRAVSRYAGKLQSTYNEGNFDKFLVTGFGKAAFAMAQAIDDTMEDLIYEGIIVTKYGHTGKSDLRKIAVFEAEHPVPDENGLRATERIIDLVKRADEKTLIVCLVSGGGSALFVSPYRDITLTEKQTITDMLLKSGADIGELNTVRKHISNVKGGRLAEIAYPARMISLILSDVIGNKLDVIASGPTSPDGTTYKDARKVLEKYNLMDTVPEKVLGVLNDGLKGLVTETPKQGDAVFEGVENIIIGSNKIALNAAKERAERLGFQTEIISDCLTGEARDEGKRLGQKALEIKRRRSKEVGKPVCLLSGGETTVTVRGNGLGGRNMELALSFAIEIEGMSGTTLLSAGTDGTDGPTDAAGAIVDGNTIKRAKNMGIESNQYLQNNDSYNFFKMVGEMLITGPTGTNVMDIQTIVIE